MNQILGVLSVCLCSFSSIFILVPFCCVPNERVESLLLFSHSVMTNSLQPHGLQHARLPCPSLSPWVYSNSRPLSWWCCLTISSSATPFSFCLQSFPVSGSFPMNWLFTSGGQSIGDWTSASILPMNIQGWFPLGLTGLILQFKGLWRAFSSTIIWRPLSSLALRLLYGPILTSIQDYWKNHNLNYMDLCGLSEVSPF